MTSSSKSRPLRRLHALSDAEWAEHLGQRMQAVAAIYDGARAAYEAGRYGRAAVLQRWAAFQWAVVHELVTM